MKLTCEFEIVGIDDQSIAVPLGADSEKVHGVLKLSNRESKEIFALLQEGKDREEITAILREKYDIEDSELNEYVDDFLKNLKEYGILE